MSNYRLYFSNRLKSFISSYGDVIRGKSLLGEKVFLVVQNRSIGEWLKLELAEKFGISANLNIILPEKAVRTFVRDFPLGRRMLHSSGSREEKAVLFMDNLKIIIYKKLEELLRTDLAEKGKAREIFSDLENYIKGTGSGESDFQTINSLRLYQLSDSIAGLFYYYGMNCQSLTSSWEKGEPFFPDGSDPSVLKHERWQMALWKELFTDSSPYVHLSSILSAIVEKEDSYEGEPVRVILFGSTFMGDSSLRFFRHLSRFIEVDHFVLSPSQSGESFSMPLLKSWGALYEGFRDLVGALATPGEDLIHRDFPERESPTLLSSIQNMFLHNGTPEEKINVAEDDRSLTVVSTTGRWREVEALKNRIIKLLEEDPLLKLTDIGVLAPDINEYAHYIEAVFPSEDSISLPFNIIDLKGEGDSPYISGFLSVLNLAGARFSRKELFSLFSNSCFAASENIDSTEYGNWLSLCDLVNIKWAVDGEHKSEMDIPGTRYNSWERGFDRILEGMALSEEEKPFEAPFPLFNESDAQSAGKLMRIIRSLHRDVNNLTGVKLRLEEWVLIWETIMDTYLSPADDSGRDERDRLRLKGCFRDILNMVNELENLDYLSDRNFDFFMFKSLLTEFIQKSGGSRGRYLTQGISCASLKPLRAVPFKVIMVLGMNEESFPAADEALSFDLKETEQVRAVTSIDLSRRTSDKYSFLEVFLSAGEKVVLFYTGRNNVDNETLQPSSLIAELGTFIEDHFKVDGRENCFTALVEQEKLQPFDRDYFSDESSLFSYSKRDFELAGIYYGARRAPEAAHEIESLTPSGEGEVLEITFQDLISFLRNPLKFFFNRSCGVFMEENELKEEDTEENVDPDFFLERAFLEDILLEGDLVGGGPEFIGEKVESFSALLNGRGELIDNELSVPSVDRIKERALELVRLSGEHTYLQTKPEPVTLTFGEKTELEKGIIESPLYCLSDGTQVLVRGTLPPLYFYPDGSIVYIGILSSSSVKKSQAFAPFLINGLLPVGIQRDRGLQAYLVSHEKVNLYSFPGDGEREDRLPLIESYRYNLTSPLPLYPEIAELLKGLDSGEGFDRTVFINLFYEKWSDLLTGYDQNPSQFRSCLYRASAYKSLPAFDVEKMIQLFQSVYGAIGLAEPKKGRK